MGYGEKDGWLMLANAVITAAAEDYRAALELKRRRPDSGAARDRIERLEGFFRSEWYGTLTDVPGEVILRRLREEAGL